MTENTPLMKILTKIVLFGGGIETFQFLINQPRITQAHNYKSY